MSAVHYHRCLAADAAAYAALGWREYGRDRCPSVADEIVLLEWTRDTEPMMPDAGEQVGKKYDSGKDRFDLLDPEHERAIVRVLTLGAKTYGDENFKLVPNAVNRYYAALRRHLNDWRRGEQTDPESGESHLAHVVVNALFLMWLDDQRSTDAEPARSDVAAEARRGGETHPESSR